MTVMSCGGMNINDCQVHLSGVYMLRASKEQPLPTLSAPHPNRNARLIWVFQHLSCPCVSRKVTIFKYPSRKLDPESIRITHHHHHYSHDDPDNSSLLELSIPSPTPSILPTSVSLSTPWARSSVHTSTSSHPFGVLHLPLTPSGTVRHNTSLTSRKTCVSASIAQMTSRCSYSGITFWWISRAWGSRPRSNRRRNFPPSTRLSLPQTQSAKGGDCELYHAREPLG